MSHRHESGSLKQTNKKHKNKNGRGKRNIKLSLGGKIQKLKSNDSNSSVNVSLSKINRLNQINQTRKNKRLELFTKKRVGSNHGPPRVVVFVTLNDFINVDSIISPLIALSSTDKEIVSSEISYCTFRQFKSRFMFITPKSRDIDDNIKICQTADIIILLTSDIMGKIEEMIDDVGSKFLYTLKSLGIPEMACIISSNSLSTTKLNETKSNLVKIFDRDACSNIKIFDNSNSLQYTLLIRHLSECSVKQLAWRSNRTYIVTDNVCIRDNDSNDIKTNLIITGYIRGRPINVNSLMHIPSIGTCRIISIESDVEPFDSHSNETLSISKVFADITKQDQLNMEALPDSLMGEQTWPDEHEMIQNDSDKNINKRIPSDRKIPEGMSDYQADWLVDDEGNWQKDDHDEDNETEDNSDNLSEENEDMDMDDKQSVISKSIRKQKSVIELDDEDKEFPDEVDTPHDMSARERFARYRALQSFRSSPWHPKENLPDSYSRIYQFENFLGAQKRVLEEGAIAERKQQEMILNTIITKKKSSNSRKSSIASMDVDDNDDNISINDLDSSNHIDVSNSSNPLCVFGMNDYIKSGEHVKISLEVINKSYDEIIDHVKNNKIITAYSLLKHENKLSVLHFSIQRTSYYDGPIKSKEPLIFQVGFRRYQCHPIFSEGNLNCDKHKVDRFLRDEKFEIASVFGPITYSPSPVLVYKVLESGTLELVATGSLNSVNPDRIMLKKVILTGYPQRVRKKAAVVKHMFYTPEDVLWFKPAELYTKHGLRGHITDTVGTHGLYKAQFNAPIKQNDTVMLILYKRVFPKLPETGLIVE